MPAPVWIPEWIELLGWVLIHFLWQGAIIGVVAWTAHSALRASSAQVRYVVLCVAMGACALAPGVTWFALEQSAIATPSLHLSHTASISTPTTPAIPATKLPTATSPISTAVALPLSSDASRFRETVDNTAPYLAGLWILGVLILSLRLLHDWIELRSLCAVGIPAKVVWQERLRELIRRMGIDRAVLLLESVRVEVPTVVGWLKPVLIVPATFFTALPANQVEAILVHELAHIRRHDYLINLIQILIETLLFYHPAIWWISRTIRQEREHCCDDLAIQIVGDKFAYATALTALEESRSLPMAITLAATGGALLQRIRRLTRIGKKEASSRVWLLLLAIGIMAGITLAVSLERIRDRDRELASDPFDNRDLSGGDHDQFDRYAMAYEMEVYNDHVDMVAAFLRHGMLVDPFAPQNRSILDIAASATDDPRLIRLLLAHGAKPQGDSDDDNSAVNTALRMGKKKVADLLIAAEGAFDPLAYDAAAGQLDDLKMRDARKPLSAAENKKALKYAVDAGQVPIFDWLWAKVRTGNAADDGKKLNGFYLAATEHGRLPLMLHLEQMGVKPLDLGAHPLEQAVYRNHIPEARHLYNLGLKLPEDPKAFRGAVGDLAGEGHVEMMNLVLDHGANINALDGEGMTPLCWAGYMRQDAACLALIARGADVNIRDTQGNNAAWYAAGGNLPDVLEQLIKMGVQLNGQDKQGFTVLTYMTSFSQPTLGQVGFPGRVLSPEAQRKYNADTYRVVGLLAAAQVNLNEPSQGGSPLYAALNGEGNYPMFRALLDHGATLGTYGPSALMAICEGGWNQPLPLDLLTRLLDLKVSSNGALYAVFDKASRSYDNPAIEQSTRDAVRILVNHDDAFGGAPTDGAREALEAAALGDLSRLQAALSHGTLPNVADANGWTPLTVALAMDNETCVQWLLARGTSVTTKTTDGYSPLWFAAMRQQEKRVKDFLAKGADPNCPGNDARDASALYWATRHKNHPICQALLAAGAKGSQDVIFEATRQGMADVVRAVLDQGVAPDVAKPLENRGSVYWAVDYNQPEILKLFLDHGADPEMKTVYNETPVSEAQQFHKNLVPILEAVIQKHHATGKDTASAHPSSNPFDAQETSPPKSLLVHVVNEQGQPLKGATVTLIGLRSKEEPGSYYGVIKPMAPATTNATGAATIVYPAHPLDDLNTGTAIVTVADLDMCVADVEVKIDSPKPLVLTRGARLVLSAQPLARVRFSHIYVDLVDDQLQSRFQKRTYSPDGRTVSVRLPEGHYRARVVALSTNGKVYFSDSLLFTIHSDKVINVNPIGFGHLAASSGMLTASPPVHEGRTVTGELDPTVPRPVKGGWVVANVSSPELDQKDWNRLANLWTTFVDVAPDGAFVLTNLPSGKLEIMAGCDGYIAKDENPKPVVNIRQAQVVTPGDDGKPVIIAMEPTGDVSITVLKPDGTPLPGATVDFYPNQRLGGATNIMGTRQNSLDYLPLEGDLGTMNKGPHFQPFTARTDANGIAVIRGLPPSKQTFQVESEGLVMPVEKIVTIPSDPSFPQIPRREGEVTVKPDAEVAAQVQMEPVGNTSLSASIRAANP